MRWQRAVTAVAGAACTALTAGSVMAGPASAATDTVAGAGVAGMAAARSADGTAAVARLGLAQQIPGLAALNEGGSARVEKISCASAGNCAAVGLYQDADHRDQVFAAFETGGTWQDAAPIPNLNALNEGGNADVSSLSCPEAGDCTAGGSYTDVRATTFPGSLTAPAAAGTRRRAWSPPTWPASTPRLTR